MDNEQSCVQKGNESQSLISVIHLQIKKLNEKLEPVLIDRPLCDGKETRSASALIMGLDSINAELESLLSKIDL